jgi:hypothetical protein
MVYTIFMPKCEHQRAVFGGETVPFPAAYDEVGILAASSLDEAVAQGQNDRAVTPTGTWNPRTPVRSLSVGDVLVDLYGHAWRIERVGYRALRQVS